MSSPSTPVRYRFGAFEADTATGELRRSGFRVKIHAQPFQLLCLLLERPGDLLTREEISRALWPGDTFVDYEHGVNSAINRIREALGDKAASPRFVETLARRGYRFVAPVERLEGNAAPLAPLPQRIEPAPAQAAPPSCEAEPALREAPATSAFPTTGAPAAVPPTAWFDAVLASPEDLPRSSPAVVQTLFVLLQVMYLGFYVGALANLPEIHELLTNLPHTTELFTTLILTAAVLIPLRTFLLCAALMHAPGLQQKFRRLWPLLLAADCLWSLAPFLLLHHINAGLALACVPPLVYSPFAQRALILMGAGTRTSASVAA